jgi:hypothetical protein
MSTLLARANSIIPITAAADHTGLEGYFVEIASGKAAVVNAVTDIPLGVIVQGDVADGKDSIAVPGGIAGTVKVKLGGAVTAIGAFLTVTTAGTVITDAGSGARVQVARALETGAADELIEAVLINPVSIAS